MIINWLGLIIGFGMVLLGQILEGGHIEQLIQPTAALIVFGGTFGATLLSSTGQEIKQAAVGLKSIFLGTGVNYGETVKEILSAANIARKEGVLALEKVVPQLKNHFFAKCLQNVVDGYDPNVLKNLMEDTIAHTEEEKNGVAKVWETAGGFSPTVGIIGAVLGLIHVMANLSDSSKLGSGIAVAFVATVYGVSSANLLFLPLANKMKRIGKAEATEMVLIYTGVVGIQNGLNPRIIEEQLKNVLGDHGSSSEKAGGAEEKQAA